MINRENAAPWHQINHVHEQIARDPHQNVRFIQRSQLRRLAHLVQHDRLISPNLRVTSPPHPHRHLLSKELTHLIHVADRSHVALRVSAISNVQNHCCGRCWELLVEMIVAIRRQTDRIGLVEIEMDGSLVRISNQRGDCLSLREEGEEKRARGSRKGRWAGRSGRKCRKCGWRDRKTAEWKDIRMYQSLWIRLKREATRGEARIERETKSDCGIPSAVQSEVSDEVERSELRHQIHVVVR